MGKELRKNLRISCSIPVLLRFVSRTPQEGWGTIYDISLGGIKLETRFHLEVGENIFLSFILGDNFIFENTRGRIIRIEEKDGYFTCGIEFDHIVDKNHLKEGLYSILDAGTQK